MKKFIPFLLICILCISSSTPSIAEASAKLNKSSITILEDETYQLKINGTSKTIAWTSSNKTVASVSKEGEVLGNSTGVSTVTAKVDGKKIKCIVSVKERKEYDNLYKNMRQMVGIDFNSNDGSEWNTKIADGKTIYPRHTIILFDDSELMCVVERFRTVDPMSTKRYIIIDFSIWNLHSSDFISSEYYLTLVDANGYTYKPTIYRFYGAIEPAGDLNMTLKPGDMARGEVTFEVPYNSPKDFVLRCDIPYDDIGRALFPIDLDRAVNQNGTQSSTVK